MECLGVQCGVLEKPVFGPITVELQRRGGRGWRRQCLQSTASPMEQDRFQKARIRSPRISAVANLRLVDKKSLAKEGVNLAGLDDWSRGFDMMETKSVDDYDDDQKQLSAEQLDQWIQDSVPEIVKNIGETPFLVHVYSESRDRSASAAKATKLAIEKATSDSWPLIKRRWVDGNSTPSGVILVEELPHKTDKMEQDKEDFDSNNGCTNAKLRRSSTKLWGLLVQGRGLSLPACYILKTCQVQCCMGFCTHFCLSKIKCSGESLSSYQNRLWLQR
ncbi:hypothetical protein Ancab_005473 [Ancistrocladus abbreviatus]